MENQGITLFYWSKNISPILRSNSAPSNPGADYNWSVNIFLIWIFFSAQNLGKIWKTLTDEQQAPFRKEAENLRYLHQLEYPDYKYRPKKRQRSGTEAAQQVQPSNCSHLLTLPVLISGAQLRPGRGQAGATRGRPLPRLRGAGAAQGGSMFSGEEVQVLWPREPGLLVPLCVLPVLPQPRLRERRADAASQGALEPGPGEW